MLAQLILSPPEKDADAPIRLQVKGASIKGNLDLGCGALAPFLFTNCTFDEMPMLNDATAEFVGFVHCRLPGLSANRLSCRGASMDIPQQIFALTKLRRLAGR